MGLSFWDNSPQDLNKFSLMPDLFCCHCYIAVR